MPWVKGLGARVVEREWTSLWTRRGEIEGGRTRVKELEKLMIAVNDHRVGWLAG
ncbi:MAG: hypothetical protein AAF268_01890 [Cyanobacteria bacterium P01_A01_bin.3]